MADDKIKIYGELESGVPDGKVVDIRQVGMGKLTIDPEGCIIENGIYPQINSEEPLTLGGGGAAAFIINPEFIGFERKGERYGLFFEENTRKFTISPSSSSSSGLTVTTYPYPSNRNILVEPERFVGIWNNITIPARSEVYARVTMNLNESSTEGHLICVGFVANAKTVASTAAPLPAVAAVEHSMCLSHWFEEETTLSVMVHSTTTAYVTDVVNPKGAMMAGGCELIVKTYA